MDPELARWIPLLQIITNVMLTIVALCIAGASLYVAYRNNFGWKPIILVSRFGLTAEPNGAIKYVAAIEFEV